MRRKDRTISWLLSGWAADGNNVFLQNADRHTTDRVDTDTLTQVDGDILWGHWGSTMRVPRTPREGSLGP